MVIKNSNLTEHFIFYLETLSSSEHRETLPASSPQSSDEALGHGLEYDFSSSLLEELDSYPEVQRTEPHMPMNVDALKMRGMKDLASICSSFLPTMDWFEDRRFPVVCLKVFA